MILTDYYRFEKLPNQKSKLRIDCTASTGSYDPLEALRNKAGDLFLYIGDNTHTKAGKERKADLALSKTAHISSIYNPDLNLLYWYGDMKGTTDAFLFVHHNTEFINGGIQAGAVIELFVARGQRNNRSQLYNALSDGVLDEEMNALKRQVTKSVTVMYDTVNFRLLQSEAGGVDFLAETPCFLENVGEHYYNGEAVITGSLNGLKISLNRYQMKIKDGSLCKWHLGDNFQTMGRGDTQRAIEKLSDTLHVPMNKATVTRLDIAQNFITKHPPEVYLSHLGILKYATRLQEPNGIYYSQTGGRLCFYDKNREQKNHREPIPELYEGRNVLRYEQRYTNRIASQFKVSEVTGAMLYDEAFYISLLNRWKEAYKAIQKINDVSLNFQAMRTKQQLYKMGVLSLIEKAGGQLQMIEQINEAQKRGELSKKQAFDLRKAINEVCKIRDGLTVPNEAIQELDKKVSEAVKYYR